MDRGTSGVTPTAIGVGGAVGTRRAPPLFNLGSAPYLMWDGRAAGIEHQVQIPIETPTEMGIDWSKALIDLAGTDEGQAFLKAVGRPTLDRDSVLASVAAYVRTLVSGSSAFDRFYYGGEADAISEQAKQGLRIFTRKARCDTCHLLTGLSSPLTDGHFHATGIGWRNGAYADDGRFAATKDPADKGLFKTPTLRNVSLRPYLMHDGSMTSLRQVVDYYNKGTTPGAANLDKRLKPLFLTPKDVDDLIAFLGTLNAPVVSYQPKAP